MITHHIICTKIFLNQEVKKHKFSKNKQVILHESTGAFVDNNLQEEYSKNGNSKTKMTIW